MPHQTAKGLDQRPKRHAADNLIAFAGGEITLLTHDGLVEFLDQRRLTNAGIPLHQHHGPVPLADVVERAEQCRDLAFSPVQLLRNQKAVDNVVLPESKGHDVPVHSPRASALLEVFL